MPIPAVISDLSPIIGTGPSPNGGQPGGGENPSTFDDYLRAYGAFIAQLRAGSGFANSGAFRIPFFDASGAWSSSADFVRDASGNVGVGQTPAFASGGGVAVYVVGTSQIALRNDATGSGATAGARLFYSGVNLTLENREPGFVAFSTLSTERMRIDASGNVGIGGAPVTGRLDVATDAAAVARLRNTVAGSTAEVYVASNDRNLTIGQRSSTNGLGDLAYLFTSSATPIAFFTSGNERMRIDASGHQINLPGSTTPPTLTVNGQLNITPTSNTNVRISFRGTDGVTRVANITLA
jgi:hypothetical protein